MKGKINLRKRDNNMEIFPYIQRMKKEKPYQLFCFPHAGGNSLTFAKWVDRSSKIDIIPISLSERGKENNYNNLVGIIAEKIIAILDDRPFFFWGHSMGAALAFSVSYYIEKKYNYFPEKLIVAARQPPFDPCAKSFRSSMGLSALLDELKNAGGTPRELLESDIFREYMLPEIMNDYVLHEGFKYHGEMINSSIVAHCGTEDIEANETIMLGWKEVTLKEFKITSFSGGHFFPHSYTKYLEELEKEIIN